eukprot:m51a1_g3193 hypothetical protein (143) ;mRNA; f:446746-447174
MALLFGTNLWDDLDAMQRQLNGVASRKRQPNNAAQAAWSPLCDLSETESEFHIDMDVPGVRKEDVAVDLHEGLLSITGTRGPSYSEGTAAVRIERATGKFGRSFTVPNGVDPASIRASLDNGVLHVAIAKPKAAIPYRVEIK